MFMSFKKQKKSLLKEEEVIARFFLNHPGRALDHYDTVNAMISQYLEVNERMKNEPSRYWEYKGRQASYLTLACMEISGLIVKINKSGDGKIQFIQSPCYDNLHVKDQWEYVSQWIDFFDRAEVKKALETCRKRMYLKAQ